ncbi:MAG: response regulator [Lachnospiraceae bacterium]|jgi:signal transduction histidine kinase/DNA-binding response OmpR family regulator|nr:response regulator [Lachnospiraceae bacterium]
MKKRISVRKQRRSKQETVKQTQDSFSALVQGFPNVALMFDDQFKLIDCNDAAITILPFRDKADARANFYSVLERMALPTQTIGSPSISLQKQLAAAAEKGELSHESDLNINGKHLVLDMLYKRIPFQDSYAIVGYGNDITKLRETQEKSQKLAHTIGLSGSYLWELDAETLYYQLVTGNFDWLGIRETKGEGYLKDRAKQMLHPEDIHILYDSLSAYLQENQEKPFSCVIRFYNFAQGGLTWVRVVGYGSEYDEQGKITKLAGSFINIDDQMKELARKNVDLLRQQQLFRNVFSTMDAAVILMPNQEPIANAKFDEIMPGWKDVFVEEQDLDTLYQFFEELTMNPQDHIDSILSLRKTKQSRETLWRFKTGNIYSCRGFVVQLDDNSEKSGELWILRDITELERTKLLFNQIFNVMDPAIAILTDGRIIANDAYSEIFTDWQREYQIIKNVDKGKDYEVLRSYWDTLITNVDDHFVAIDKLRATHELQQSTWHFRNGNECIQKGYWLSLGQEGGELWVLTDVTDFYDAIRRANEASLAKSMFLSSMSHEIRTPMNAIIGMTSLARKSHDLLRIQRYLEKTEEAGHRLMALINDILDMSKIESGKLQIAENEFDYIKMCENAVNVIADKAMEKRIDIKIFYQSQFTSLVWADELRISQVIMNLLSNAVKFTPEGGSVTLTTKVIDDHLLRVSCADNGIGINQEAIPKLFRNFEQANKSITREYGGTGLGLALCKQIVELMGGNIQVESQPGKGSTFTFEIPFEWRGTIKVSASIGDVLMNTRILVVDDEPDITEYFTELLKSYYISSDTADSGTQALRLAQTAKEENNPYKIAFIDWKMPDISGAETARKLRQILPDCKVIIISSYEWDEIRSSFENDYDRYAIDFMPKPIPPSDIYNRIIQLLNVEVYNTDVVNFKDKKILLVEDVEINRQIVIDLLEDTECQIDEAPNGQIAVEAAKKQKYDLILMDLQMPVMDGLTATREIRKFNTKIPIVAMTANAFREDAQACFEAGMSAHISKPLDNDVFMRTLSEYLQESK